MGVNLEFPGLPLQHSVHAEQFLIANAAWHGERGLLRIAVNAAPCGHCRQFIAELITAVRVRLPHASHGVCLCRAECDEQLRRKVCYLCTMLILSPPYASTSHIHYALPAGHRCLSEADQAIAWMGGSLQETIELAYKGHSYRLNDILVDKFCPSDLIEPGTAPLLLEQQRNDVHFSESAEATLQQRPELRVCYSSSKACLPAQPASLCASPGGLIIPSTHQHP